jgi:glyoxylase-like metal-dependent hydrolase (beta-lactamase superfamily II)
MFYSFYSNYNAIAASLPYTRERKKLRQAPLLTYCDPAMAKSNELTRISPNYAIWQAYDLSVKADLFSTAIQIRHGLMVIDPIPMTAPARIELEAMGEICAALLTNANHARAITEFAGPESCWVPDQLSPTFGNAQILTGGARIHGLDLIAINGAAPGEFAFHDARDGGTLIVGDALINFGRHGFTLLPVKYCTNRKQMIRSLRALLDLSFARIFFAHGQPILSGARDRLAALLDTT